MVFSPSSHPSPSIADTDHLGSAPDAGLVSVSADFEDHLALREMLDGTGLTIIEAKGLREGLQTIARKPWVIICASHLGDGGWRDLIGHLADLLDPPMVIVTTALSNISLWAEALHLGAYDVLAKPFDAAEVRRTVRNAVDFQHRLRLQQSIDYALDDLKAAPAEAKPAAIARLAEACNRLSGVVLRQTEGLKTDSDSRCSTLALRVGEF